jgi:thioredoxin-like negative regulator of GroEL
MTKEAKGVVAGGVAAVAVLVVVLVAFQAPEPSRALGPGVSWQELSIEDALSQAGEQGRRVLVKFDAEWCSYCRTLESEVLGTRAGGELTADMVAVGYDFDDEANRPLIERYVVLGLPTVLVLTPDGTQVGRIMGYDGAEDWTRQLRAAKQADDPIPSLRAAHARSPDDPEATLRLGEALLVRGGPEEGESLLERVLWLQGEGADEASAEALFILGRYYHRVRRDARTARHIWRELAARYPDNAWAGGAWSWYAKAQAEIGQPQLGLSVLRGRVEAEPDNVSRVAQWASFITTHDLSSDREAAREALAPLVAQEEDAEDRAELQELLDKLAQDPNR